MPTALLVTCCCRPVQIVLLVMLTELFPLCFQVHWPFTDKNTKELTPPYRDTWEEMEKLVEAVSAYPLLLIKAVCIFIARYSSITCLQCVQPWLAVGLLPDAPAYQ